MSATRELKILISAEDAASGVIARVQADLAHMVAGIASGQAVYALLSGAVHNVVRHLEEAQAAARGAELDLARLTQAFALGGGGAAEAAERALEFSHALARSTQFSAEQVRASQLMLATLGHLRGEGLERATRAAADLAAVLGKDLTATALALTKAAQGNTQGLRKLGFSLDEVAGTPAEKFKRALEQIEAAAGGASTALAGTAEAARNRLAKAWEEFEVEAGKGPARIKAAFDRTTVDLLHFYTTQLRDLNADREMDDLARRLVWRFNRAALQTAGWDAWAPIVRAKFVHLWEVAGEANDQGMREQLRHLARGNVPVDEVLQQLTNMEKVAGAVLQKAREAAALRGAATGNIPGFVESVGVSVAGGMKAQVAALERELALRGDIGKYLDPRELADYLAVQHDLAAADEDQTKSLKGLLDVYEKLAGARSKVAAANEKDLQAILDRDMEALKPVAIPTGPIRTDTAFAAQWVAYALAVGQVDAAFGAVTTRAQMLDQVLRAVTADGAHLPADFQAAALAALTNAGSAEELAKAWEKVRAAMGRAGAEVPKVTGKFDAAKKSWKQFSDGVTDWSRNLTDVGVGAINRVSAATGDAIASGNSWRDAMRGVIDSIVSDLIRLAAQYLITAAAQAVLDAISFVNTGGAMTASAGAVARFAPGGRVVGGSRDVGVDVIPALLTPGERVLSRAESDRYAQTIRRGNQPAVSLSFAVFGPRRLAEELIPEFNHAVRARGATLYATKVTG